MKQREHLPGRTSEAKARAYAASCALAVEEPILRVQSLPASAGGPEVLSTSWSSRSASAHKNSCE